MKRIATITYSWSQNWGAVLQAYALNEFLVQQGYNAKIIDYREFDNKVINTVKSIPDGIVSLILYFQGKKRVERFNEFRKKHFRLTSKCVTEEELRRLNKDFDVFITGSDQIWNVGRGVNKNFYLHFVEESKNKISYAGSFGVSEIPSQHEQDTITGLKNLNSISVRENSGAKLVEKYIGKSVPVVLDPVFLLSKQNWENLCCGERLIKEPYIFVYPTQVTPILKKTVKYFAINKKLKVVSPFCIEMGMVRKDIGPIEFINLVKNADFVIGSSFHALAFSLIFNRDFVVIPHSSTGSRVKDLLENVGLQNRIMFSTSDLKGLEERINYEKLNSNMTDLIQFSKKYLIDAIENKN